MYLCPTPLSTLKRARSALALMAGLMVVSLFPSIAAAEEADLTQFGPKTYERSTGQPTTASSTFNAAQAPARLIVRGDEDAMVTIRLNGKTVVGPGHRDGATTSTAVDLLPTNRIEVQLRGKVGTKVKVRVKQHVTVDTRATGVGIYGLQVTDFERQLGFWDDFGLKAVINPAGPETNTIEMAQVLGLTEPYRLKVSLHWLSQIGVGAAADTVQFIDPFNPDPPYAKLNHIGYTHVTYGTRDLDGAVSFLRSRGVTVTSDPVGTPGSRYAFVRDSDGTYFQLVEDSGAPGTATPTALTRMTSIALNVSDLQATTEFLKLFGFTQAVPAGETVAAGSREAVAWGVPAGFRNTGFDLSNPAQPDGPKIQVRKWKSPYDSEPAYPLPMNHLGLDRLIFNNTAPNLLRVAESLKAAGVSSLGPPARCCNGYSSPGGIALWTGPDGIIVEMPAPIPFPPAPTPAPTR
jgi:catechol 2,3-dioxygenase-like lactoylglutathione lyase family enzyme